jgi:pimeloyl-ACP methyl ester carboxylesterase
MIYLLSGLGADKRVFDFIEFGDFPVKHIDWIPPFTDESIEAYAQRLTTQIKDSQPILIGVSFGGIIAMEIAKQTDCKKVILISSAETKYEIPFLFRLAGSLRLYKLIPAAIFKNVNSFTQWMFGTTSQAENDLLKEIIKSTDEKFLKWAIHKIASWKNIHTLLNSIKIHGTNDRILPSKKADYLIESGGHFMIVNKASKISKIIQSSLA